MTLTYSQIVAQHQALQKEETAEASPERVERVKAFIAEVVAAGANIADPRQREQLRNFLRYWSAYVYDHTKEFPPSQLAPFLGTGTGGSRFDLRSLMPGLWMLVGVGLVLLAGLLLRGLFTGSTSGPSATSTSFAATSELIETGTPALAVTSTPEPSTTPLPSPTSSPTPRPTVTDVPGALFSLPSLGTAGSVAFSPDGKFLAIGDANGFISLWNVEDQTLVWKSLPLEGKYVFTLAFSPSNGGTLAVGVEAGHLGLLSAVDGSVLIATQAHSDSVTSVAFSPDGARLVTGSIGGIQVISDTSGIQSSPDAPIAFWDPDTLDPRDFYRGNPKLSIAFSPDGKLLAAGGTDKEVKVWDLETRRPATLGEHTDVVCSVAFSPDGKVLASASQDGSVKLWDVEKRTLITTLPGQATSLFAMAFSPDPNRLRLASAGSAADGSGLIELWEVEAILRGEDSLPTPLTGHTAVVRSLAFSPDGKLLASGSRDRTVIVWKVP